MASVKYKIILCQSLHALRILDCELASIRYMKASYRDMRTKLEDQSAAQNGRCDCSGDASEARRIPEDPAVPEAFLKPTLNVATIVANRLSGSRILELRHFYEKQILTLKPENISESNPTLQRLMSVSISLCRSVCSYSSENAVLYGPLENTACISSSKWPQLPAST
jgi:hypothetical protein